MMKEPKFLTLTEARAQEEYYQKIEEEYWKYGHMMGMTEHALEMCVRNSIDPRAVEIAQNMLDHIRTKRGGLFAYCMSKISKPVIVPEKITKEMIEDLLSGDNRPKRNYCYPPNTSEMEAIILRMIEELPNGTYKIKTIRDESK